MRNPFKQLNLIENELGHYSIAAESVTVQLGLLRDSIKARLDAVEKEVAKHRLTSCEYLGTVEELLDKLETRIGQVERVLKDYQKVLQKPKRTYTKRKAATASNKEGENA